MKKEKLEEVYSNNINFNKIIKTNINNSYKNKSKKIFSISKKIFDSKLWRKKIIKEFKTYINDDNFYDKNKRTKKELKSKCYEKYEKKRKELMILDKQKKMEEIKKNIKEQLKKKKKDKKFMKKKLYWLYF